jgi:hypothetical protein
VPTTLFIDASGKIVGDAIIGSQEAEKYMEAVLSRLSDAGTAEASNETGPAGAIDETEPQVSGANDYDLYKSILSERLEQTVVG